MPSPPWTTPDQTEFLEHRLPDFLAAQRNKTTAEFWKTIYRDFFEKWTDPQDEIQAVIVPKKRKAKGIRLAPDGQTHTEWVQLRKCQIANWYNNRRNGVSHRRQTSAVVIGGSTSNQRILSEINLYSKKYYNERVRPVAAEAWKVAQEQSLHCSRISVINKTLTQCWQGESDKIKQEICEEYERLKELRNQPAAIPVSPPSPESFVEAQIALPDLIKSFMEEMQKRTGFAFTIITGGPDAFRPGRMRVLGFHQGTDRFGQKFGAAYASFKPNILEPFQKFLYNVYSEQERADCVVPHVQTNTKEIAVNPQEPPSKMQKLLDGEATLSPSSVPNVPTSAMAGPSTSPTRDHSTTNPSTALATPPTAPLTAPTPAPLMTPTPTPLTAPVTALTTPPLTAPTPALTVPTTTPTTPLLQDIFTPMSSADMLPVAGPSSRPNISSDLSSGTQSTPVLPQLYNVNLLPFDDIPFSYEEYMAAMEGMEALNKWDIGSAHALGSISTAGCDVSYMNGDYNTSLPPSLDGSCSTAAISSVSGGIGAKSDEMYLLPSETSFGTVPGLPKEGRSNVEGATSMGTGESQLHISANMGNRMPAGLTFQSCGPISPSQATTSSQGHVPYAPLPAAPCAVPEQENIAPVPPIAAISATPTLAFPPALIPERAALQDPKTTPLTEQRLNVPAPAGTSEVGDKIDEKTLGVEERPSRNRKPPMSKEIQPVAWLDLAHSYLTKELDDPMWKNCIDQWFQFERAVMNDMEMNSRRIPAKGRPPLLSKWVGTRNYGAIPKIPDVAAFALEWIHWWNEMQPKWRKSATSSGLPLSVDSAVGTNDLSPIKKGGPTGLVVVLIGLKWWAGMRSTDGRWELAVADIKACVGKFSHSASELVSSRKKRG